MRHKNTTIGLLGAMGIWVTAGLALPFVNVLQAFSPGQLMVFRGFFTALMAIAIMRSVPWKVDRPTYLIALILPFATLGLFEGIRAWGAGPTLIILAATPVVNFALSPLLKRTISSAAIVGLVLMLVGVVIARWGGTFSWIGLAWSAFATLTQGIVYELMTRAQTTRAQKCFWGMLGMGTLGLILSFNDSWAAAASPKLLVSLVCFAFVSGFLYWFAYMLAFDHLPTNEASVLAQGETPAVIIGAALLLGERLTLLQWFGVGIALFGAWRLSRWLDKHTT